MICERRCSFLLIIFIVLSFVFGCGTDHAAKAPPTVDLAIKKKTDRLNEVIMLSAASRANTVDDYLVGPEDLLEIEAYNVEECKKTIRVNSQGNISLPLVGIIEVKGKTTSEIEKKIAQKLEQYVQEPVVSVFVKEYRSQKISVVGAVNTPQVYAITGQRYLIDMLLSAGGLREDAGSVCYIIRPTKEESQKNLVETIVIDLDELLINGNFNLNIPVFAGDVINIPKGGVIFVDGAVRSPGVFNMRGKTTVVTAITMAKGLSPIAKASDIRILRDNGTGERDIITVDYDAISKGDSPDILVAENDIIIVPTSGMKSFFNSLRGLVSFGSGASVGMAP
jgi:polysaccharide export outer membrane protein